MNNKANCITISSGQPFLEVLASWLMREHGKSALGLAEALVLLPNRRSCRALRETFLRLGGGQPQLLPRIHSLGDLTEAGDEGLPAWMPSLSIKASMPASRRQFLLTKLILAAEADYSPANAFDLAKELASLMDEAMRHELDMNELSQLTPDHLSAHWQRTLDFLKLLTLHWPRILKEEGLIDASSQRHHAYLALTEYWRDHPPSYPVIAAGSTGSQPATAMLLGTIARLPKGTLILPGLDHGISDPDWDALTPTHPQYVLKELLERIKLSRGDVTQLAGNQNPRQDLLRSIFAPAKATARWKEQVMIEPDATTSLRVLTPDSQSEEARLIALLLREVLETPAKTAALVTPDRALATMVAAQMLRFGTQLDDSAGIPLLDTPTGVFMQLVLNWIESDSPVDLLAMLRHPFTALGMDNAQCRILSRELEVKLLRGLRRHDSLEHMASICNNHDLAHLLRKLEHLSLPIRTLYKQGSTDVSSLIEVHIALCEALASTDHEDGTQILWQKESGNKLAEVLAELVNSSRNLPPIQPQSYAALFRVMLSEHVYRPSFGQHPRLSILSPMEARLQSYDRVILASLNEGTWPALPESSPWLSRSMKTDFGLPPVDRAIGQSAHDVFQLMACDEVFLTRARKISGVVQVPSRWLVRMQILIEGHAPKLWQSMQVLEHYRNLAAWLDAPEEVPTHTKPKPRPPLAARANSLSTTAIERFTRNPYDCYAETVLRLKPLDPLEEEPSSKHFGQVIHRAMEQFAKRNPSRLPANLRSELRECGRVAFAQMLHWPAVKALWWPRFESILPWLEQAERESRVLSSTILAEQNVNWQMANDGIVFNVTARIDRLDIRHDGTVAIIDYKTGTPPNQREIDHAEINQLALYALCLCHGKLAENVFVMPSDYERYTLHYWRLAGQVSECLSQQISTDLNQAKEKLKEVIGRYRDPNYAFESHDDPTMSFRHSPYQHLSRRAEWDSL